MQLCRLYVIYAACLKIGLWPLHKIDTVFEISQRLLAINKISRENGAIHEKRNSKSGCAFQSERGGRRNGEKLAYEGRCEAFFGIWDCYIKALS